MPIDPRDGGPDDWIVPPSAAQDPFPDDWIPAAPSIAAAPTVSPSVSGWTPALPGFAPQTGPFTANGGIFGALAGMPNSGGPLPNGAPGLPTLEKVTCQGPTCTQGGSYGTTGMYRVLGRNLCRDCAVKALGIQGLPAKEQTDILRPFLR